MNFDLETLARYPFLNPARKYVESLGLTMEGIQKHPIYSASINWGRKRLTDALNGRINADTRDEIHQELTILSYPIARLIANLSGNKFLVKTYANAEAENAYEFLKNEKKELVQKIMEDVGFPVKDNTITYSDYLKLASELAKKNERWKLSNMVLHNGIITLNDADNLVLLRETIRLKISEPVDTRKAPTEIKKIAESIKTYDGGRREIKINEVKNTALPPCITYMLSLLDSGEASHNVMFILATFFSRIGLSEDEVVRIFSRYPNFDEKKTRYQLEFLTGTRGGTKYSCPGCSKIKSYGLCKADCNVKHPTQYYRRH